MKLQLKNFKRKQQSKALQNSKRCSNNTDSSYVHDNDNFTSLLDAKDQNTSEPKTKKRKSFNELSKKMMRNCTNEPLITLNGFIASENRNASIDNACLLIRFWVIYCIM